jgi:hypothetical protein
MRQILYLVEPGAILIAFIALFFLLAAISRGRLIPQCFQCGAIKVRPSRPTGFWDLTGTFFQIKAYRCAGCQSRFHAMRLFHRARPHSAS